MYNIYVDGVFIESFITEEEAKAYSATMLIEVSQHQYDKLESWPFPTRHETYLPPSQLDLFTGESPVIYQFPTSPKP